MEKESTKKTVKNIERRTAGKTMRRTDKKTDKRIEKKAGKTTDKTIEKNTVVLKADENVGAVQIADDVVAMIASLATTEIEGVCGMAGNITNELMSKVGMKNLTKGVRVDILEGNVTIDLAVTMEYGYNIPVTCQKVQAKVKNAVENMTGLTCSDVNIRIAGISMKK